MRQASFPQATRYRLSKKGTPPKSCLNASAGNRTRVNRLEGSYAHHYTTRFNSVLMPVRIFAMLCFPTSTEHQRLLFGLFQYGKHFSRRLKVTQKSKGTPEQVLTYRKAESPF